MAFVSEQIFLRFPRMYPRNDVSSTRPTTKANDALYGMLRIPYLKTSWTVKGKGRLKLNQTKITKTAKTKPIIMYLFQSRGFFKPKSPIFCLSRMKKQVITTRTIE